MCNSHAAKDYGRTTWARLLTATKTATQLTEIGTRPDMTLDVARKNVTEWDIGLWCQ